MMKSIVALAVVCMVLPSAFAYKWTSCGTRYDRLKTQTLSFSASPGLEAGAMATIHTTGSTDLHVPFITGAWQVRIYELGFAHSIDTAFGDLSSALKFTDEKNTTYSFTASFRLPKAKGPSKNFTASLISTDQSKSTYNCLEIQYTYDDVEETTPSQELTLVDGPHFWSCGTSSDKVKVKGISIKPAVPKAGEKITISASGTSSEKITSGQIKYVAGLDGIPLIHATKDLCSLLKEAHITCPVPAGPIDIGLSVNLPGFVPPGNYSATAHAYDQNGAELLCMTGYFVLA